MTAVQRVEQGQWGQCMRCRSCFNEHAQQSGRDWVSECVAEGGAGATGLTVWGCRCVDEHAQQSGRVLACEGCTSSGARVIGSTGVGCKHFVEHAQPTTTFVEGDDNKENSPPALPRVPTSCSAGSREFWP